MDAFTDVNHGLILSKEEVEHMYFVEYKHVVEMAEEIAKTTNVLLETGKIEVWEHWAKILRGLQN